MADTIDFSGIKRWGAGLIVEVDETKLGKRKYHKGHKVKGARFVAEIERTSEKKMVLLPVEKRDFKKP